MQSQQERIARIARARKLQAEFRQTNFSQCQSTVTDPVRGRSCAPNQPETISWPHLDEVELSAPEVSQPTEQEEFIWPHLEEQNGGSSNKKRSVDGVDAGYNSPSNKKQRTALFRATKVSLSVSQMKTLFTFFPSLKCNCRYMIYH